MKITYRVQAYERTTKKVVTKRFETEEDAFKFMREVEKEGWWVFINYDKEQPQNLAKYQVVPKGGW